MRASYLCSHRRPRFANIQRYHQTPITLLAKAFVRTALCFGSLTSLSPIIQLLWAQQTYAHRLLVVHIFYGPIMVHVWLEQPMDMTTRPCTHYLITNERAPLINSVFSIYLNFFFYGARVVCNLLMQVAA